MKRINIKSIVTCATISITILGVYSVAYGEVLSPEEMNSIKGFACVANCNQVSADCGADINNSVCSGGPCNGGACTGCWSGGASVTCTGPQNAKSCTETTVSCSLVGYGDCHRVGGIPSPVCTCVIQQQGEESCGNRQTCQSS